MSLIRVKAFHYEGKEMKDLDDNRIVDLYLSRDEAAISQTSEKYIGKQHRLSGDPGGRCFYRIFIENRHIFLENRPVGGRQSLVEYL